MNRPLENKKILFFGLETFGYEKKILEKMQSEGALVDYYSERPVSSKFGKTIVKFFPKLLKKTTEKYYHQIIQDHKNNKYDVILIIKCDLPTKKVLKELKETFPEAELRLHLWDSLNNVPDIKEKISLFDRVTSFDRKDCLDNSNFGFRPLFFADAFREVAAGNADYNLSFCGTIHSDRYPILEKIRKSLEANKKKFYGYYYFQSYMAYFYHKILVNGYKNSKMSEFKFNQLCSADVNKINQKSKAILDIQHPNQIGLTMRTIESIGSKRKLVTTNPDIVNYDFYNPNNICVIDRNNPQIDEDFLNSEYENLPSALYEKYSLRQWVIDVLTM